MPNDAEPGEWVKGWVCESARWRELWAAYRQTAVLDPERGEIFGSLDHHWREVTDDPIAVQAKAAVEQLRELERQQLTAAQARIEELEGERDVYKAIIEAATLESVDAVSAVSMREKFCKMREELGTAQARVVELEGERDNWKRQHDAVLSQARKDNLRAEDADRYERWLLELGSISGCGHVDERLPRVLD